MLGQQSIKWKSGLLFKEAGMCNNTMKVVMMVRAKMRQELDMIAELKSLSESRDPVAIETVFGGFCRLRLKGVVFLAFLRFFLLDVRKFI